MDLTYLQYAILHAMLNDPGCVGEVMSRLTAEDFDSLPTRGLFEAVSRLYLAGSPVDAVTVLREAGEDFLPALEEAARHPAGDAAYYCGLLREGMQAESVNSYLDARLMELARKAQVSREAFAELTDGRRCHCGFDLGKRIDLSGAGAVFPLPDGRYGIKAHGFLPENAAQRHEQTDRVPYIAWARGGFCTLTPGDVTDNGYVDNWICAGERDHGWKVDEVDYDGHNATDLAIRMCEERNNPDFCVEVAQTCAGQNLAVKGFRELLLQGRLVLEENPLLIWCLGNAIEVQNNFGDVKLNKKSDLNALSQAVTEAITVTFTPAVAPGTKTVSIANGTIPSGAVTLPSPASTTTTGTTASFTITVANGYTPVVTSSVSTDAVSVASGTPGASTTDWTVNVTGLTTNATLTVVVQAANVQLSTANTLTATDGSDQSITLGGVAATWTANTTLPKESVEIVVTVERWADNGWAVFETVTSKLPATADVSGTATLSGSVNVLTAGDYRVSAAATVTIDGTVVATRTYDTVTLSVA